MATEILRGRQRTRTERLASWRVGDRARGWASVWALHDDAQLARHLAAQTPALSPHPEGSSVPFPSPRRKVVTTRLPRPSGVKKPASRSGDGPDPGGGTRLAVAWRADPHSPSWARRHTPQAWARLLASPARQRWTARDLNALVGDWIGVHGALPDSPHRPIGLLGAMLAWHGDHTARPAALDDAREAEELAAARARVTAQRVDRARAVTGRAVERAAVGGAGHTAAREAAAAIAAAALARRTHTVAAEVARHDAAVRAARGLDPEPADADGGC